MPVTSLREIAASPAELLESGERVRDRAPGVREVVEEGHDGRQPRRFLLWVTDRRLLFLYVDRDAHPPRISTVSLPYGQIVGLTAERGGSFLTLGLASGSVALGLASAALNTLMGGLLGMALFLGGIFGLLHVLFPPYKFTLTSEDGTRLSVAVAGRYVRPLQEALKARKG